MHLSTMFDWISWIESIHISEIDLGLDRVKAVAERLDLLNPACPVIIVGGTNGKGSTVATLDSIYRMAGYQVGTFTSPFLFKLNEEVRINGNAASDEDFVSAFSKIEQARGKISLTPFEFYTLAALMIFTRYQLDIIILEVGLGGRLDAVNIIDANVAIITSIGIDHTNYLGNTRDAIGFEKAGIFRPYLPAICGDANPPNSVLKHAQDLSTVLYTQGKDFHFVTKQNEWTWSFNDVNFQHLSYNSLLTQNMSTVLMAVTLLQDKLPVNEQAIKRGLQEVKITGRIQIIPGAVTEIYDVSHNPEAVELLKNKINTLPNTGKTYAVFSMLADKDIASCISIMREQIDEWFVSPLAVKRSITAENLAKEFAEKGINAVHMFNDIHQAYQAAHLKAQEGDRIIIFGSFHTVADVMTSCRRY